MSALDKHQYENRQIILMTMILNRLLKKVVGGGKSLRYHLALRSEEKYIAWLRSQGIRIGNGCHFRSLKTTRIDLTRPSLITIGDNVDMNLNFQILTHDWASGVFRVVYGDLINSSGAVKIGSNIYFGTDVVVLKGVEIGDNCIIGAGSIVTHSIPSNSVAAGAPARVVCTLDEYYSKRKKRALDEAFEYARSIKRCFGRKPVATDFWEEFPWFVDSDNLALYPEIPVKRQLGPGYEKWLKQHKREFDGLEEFLRAAGV